MIFADHLQDPEWREQFASEPEAALEAAGADVSSIPSELLDGMKALSSDELATLAVFCEKLKNAGFTVDVEGVGIFCYF
jgi:hypothetical protein